MAASLLSETRGETRNETRVVPEQVARCYEMLRETFAPDELNAEATILKDLSSPAPDERYAVFARFAETTRDDSGRPPAISLIAGCYLALDSPGIAIGFIEYLATRPGFRQQGHASALLDCFEREMRQIADSQGRRLAMIIGEVEPELLSFKRKRGYRWPRGSRYAQPPISFDLLSGVPLAPPVPKLLMVKPYEDALDYRLFLEAMHTVLKRRFVPKDATPFAAQRATDYITHDHFAPFAASLCTQHNTIIFD